MRILRVVVWVVLFHVATEAAADPTHLFLVPSVQGSTATDSQVLQYDSRSGEFDGVLVQPVGQDQIRDVILGPDGLLYATYADHSVPSIARGTVRRFDMQGNLLGTFVPTGSGGLAAPQAIAFGPDGNLYVASNDGHVFRYDGKTGAPLGVFASGLAIPEDLVFGPDGNLYVSNVGTCGVNCLFSNVRRFDGATGAFLGDFVSTNSGGLFGALGIAFGRNGDLYVASAFNDSVFRYDGTTGAFVDQFALPNIGSGPNVPTDVVFGPDADLYVARRNDAGLGTTILQLDPSDGAFIANFISPLGGDDTRSFGIGMLFIDPACARLGEVSGEASGCYRAPKHVPEPNSLSLVGGVLVLLALRQRQRMW
jgi:DNA-binding beta-propeller fold protein YncE